MNLEKKIEITNRLSNNWFPERRDNGEKNWMEGKGGLRVESKKPIKPSVWRHGLMPLNPSSPDGEVATKKI